MLRLSRAALFVLVLAGCAARQSTDPTTPDGDPVDNVSGPDLFARGMASARRGDLLRAEQYFVASVQRGEPEGRVMRYIVDVCVAGGRYRAALAYALPYLDHNRGDWRLRFLVATIHSGLGETTAAREQLNAVLVANADHAGAHYMLGSMLRAVEGERAGAEQHLRRYLELEPEGARADEVRASLLRSPE